LVSYDKESLLNEIETGSEFSKKVCIDISNILDLAERFDSVEDYIKYYDYEDVEEFKENDYSANEIIETFESGKALALFSIPYAEPEGINTEEVLKSFSIFTVIYEDG
jgi:hypothetical protein